jgi:hypothetical protein
MADTFSIASEHPVHSTSDLGPAGDKGEGYTAQPKESQAPATVALGSEPAKSDNPEELLSSPKGGTTGAPH